MLPWQIRDRVLDVSARPLVMGIVNVTPDSFSDGGRFLATDAAIAHGLELVRQGADLLDIGGESTRPGATPVPVEDELRRVTPVVEELVRQTGVPLSIDTSKAPVAEACFRAGAHVLNDVTALTGDPAMSGLARAFRVGVILMHMQGTPATMQLDPRYDDVVHDIAAYFRDRLQRLEAEGWARNQLVLDPGIGFGKRSEHNLVLLRRLPELLEFDVPICLGVSRKGFLGRLLDRPLEQRLAGSLAVVSHALAQRAVHVVRVHDVAETVDTIRVWSVLQGL